MKYIPVLIAKLKSLPAASVFLAGLSKTPLLGWASTVSQKFAAGTIVTKVGISALSISMAGATGLGGYLAVKQFVGSAGSQYVITAPASGATLSGDFPIETEFRAASNIVNSFNIEIELDGRTITSKVVSPINNGEKRKYVFSGGYNGDNLFPLHNLRPGNHTIRTIARHGSVIGQGGEFARHEVGFIAKPRNIIATGEGETTIAGSQLPVSASTRSASAEQLERFARTSQRGISAREILQQGAKTAAAKVQQIVLPKASAHSCAEGCRHGDLDVRAVVKGTDERVPGVTVKVSHGRVSCHNGDVQTTKLPGGDANFRDCGVSTELSGDPVLDTQAIYNVEVSNTPAGFSLDDVSKKQVTIVHNQNKDITFFYKISGSSTDPGSGQPSGPGGGGTGPAPSYNHSPGDGPLLAVTKLSVNSALVDVFGYQTKNNLPADFVKDVSLTVYSPEGTVEATAVRNDLTVHPSHRGVLLNLGPSGINLRDGREHTLVFKATNDNGASNMVTIFITGSGGQTAPPPTGGGNNPTPPAQHTGIIQVTAYAHDSAGQPLNKNNDNRVGNVYITPESIGSVKQCPRSGGLTNADRGAGRNFGVIHFRDCPVAEQAGSDNHAKKYRVSMNIPTGFTLDDEFNRNTGATVEGNVVYRTITVRKNLETEVSFLLIGNNGSVWNPNTQSSPAPNQPGENPGSGNTLPSCDVDRQQAGVSSPTNGTGTVAVCAYDTTNGGKVPLGGVEVHTKSIGAPDNPNSQCNPRNKTTGTSGAPKGRATFTNCPVANDGGDKTYQLSFVQRKAGCDNSKYHFKISRNQAKRIEIYLTQGSGSPTCDQTNANPGNIGGPSGTPTSSNKAGKITIETWVDKANGGSGKDSPAGNVFIEMRSTGRPDRCKPESGRTSGNPAAIGFTNCPVAVESNNNNYQKQWEIFATLPDGYKVSSNSASSPSMRVQEVFENGVWKVRRIVDLEKNNAENFSILLQQGTPGQCSGSTGGSSPDCSNYPDDANAVDRTCSEIKADLPGLNREQSNKYTDYLCGAAGRYKINAALQLAIISQESMGGSLLSDPISKKWECGTFCGPGQFTKSTWDGNKRDGVKFGGRDDGGSDGNTSAWNDQKWSDAVYTGAYYIAKNTNINRTNISEADVRHVYCKYKRPANSCSPGTSGYNTSGTNQVVDYWKQYSSSEADSPSGTPSSGSYGDCNRQASNNISSVTGSRAEIESRLLKFATSACQNRLRFPYTAADTVKGDINNPNKTETNLLKLMIVIIENGGIILPVNVLNTGHSCPSQHCDGKAIDIGYYSDSSAGKKMYEYIYANRSGLRVDELIYAPPPSGTNCMDDGKVISGGSRGCRSFYKGDYAGHDNHIHMSVRN
jgi:hypothetical protein